MFSTLVAKVAEIDLRNPVEWHFYAVSYQQVLDSLALLIEFPGPHIGRHYGNTFYISDRFAKNCTFTNFFKFFCFDFLFLIEKLLKKS